MKTIGMLGGMSWESTLPYYRIVNQAVRERLGGLHSAKIVLYSVDFNEIVELQRKGQWDEAGAQLATAAQALERAGAQLLVVCTNTMHIVAPQIEAAIGIPLLHIADATADAIGAAGLTTVGLLGTRFTMEQAFYREHLTELHGLQVLVPPPEDQAIVHRVIFDELCVGRVDAASRDEYRRIMARLVERGAQGIILGCTEITLLIGEGDATVPLFDTTLIHARAVVELALQSERSNGAGRAAAPGATV